MPTTTTTTSAPPRTSAIASPVSAAQSDVQWGPGEMLIGDAVDLDQVPPTVTPMPGASDLGVSISTLGSPSIRPRYGKAVAALWEGEVAPGHAECDDRMATHAQAEVTVDVGDMVCVRSNEKRTGLLLVTSIDSSGFPGSMMMTVTVWPQP